MGISKRIIILTTVCIYLTTFCWGQDKPIILMQGQPAPYNGFLFSEAQFDNLLILKANYEIDKKLWVEKEKIYQEAIKEAEKKMDPPFWKSGKFNFILGMVVVLVSAYVLGRSRL